MPSDAGIFGFLLLQQGFRLSSFWQAAFMAQVA